MMLRIILISAAALTLAAGVPAMAQSTTGDSYTTMPPPAGYDEPTSDNGYVDVPGTNHRDSADSPSSANGSASSAGTAGTSGGSAGTGSAGGAAASARR
jgi:hypothetical protein